MASAGSPKRHHNHKHPSDNHKENIERIGGPGLIESLHEDPGNSRMFKKKNSRLNPRNGNSFHSRANLRPKKKKKPKAAKLNSISTRLVEGGNPLKIQPQFTRKLGKGVSRKAKLPAYGRDGRYEYK